MARNYKARIIRRRTAWIDHIQQARVVKLVDAGDSKSPAARRVGSSPTSGTTTGNRHAALPMMRAAALQSFYELQNRVCGAFPQLPHGSVFRGFVPCFCSSQVRKSKNRYASLGCVALQNFGHGAPCYVFASECGDDCRDRGSVCLKCPWVTDDYFCDYECGHRYCCSTGRLGIRGFHYCKDAIALAIFARRSPWARPAETASSSGTEPFRDTQLAP